MGLLSSIFGKEVPTLTALELQEKLKNGNKPYVLDVRQPEEFWLGHIPGAILIPLGELGRRIKEVPIDREIVCICAPDIAVSRQCTNWLLLVILPAV